MQFRVSIPLRKVSREFPLCRRQVGYWVSIPLRKVSRRSPQAPGPSRPAVSIPLRKVSRRIRMCCGVLPVCRFHPSKEGFKGHYCPPPCQIGRCFHPSKEGFKVRGRPEVRAVAPVSIPLRKVSRAVASPVVKACLNGFHPSKEGFKDRAPGQDVPGAVHVSIPLRKVSRSTPSGSCWGTQTVSIPLRKVSREYEAGKAVAEAILFPSL